VAKIGKRLGKNNLSKMRFVLSYRIISENVLKFWNSNFWNDFSTGPILRFSRLTKYINFLIQSLANLHLSRILFLKPNQGNYSKLRVSFPHGKIQMGMLLSS